MHRQTVLTPEISSAEASILHTLDGIPSRFLLRAEVAACLGLSVTEPCEDFTANSLVETS